MNIWIVSKDNQSYGHDIVCVFNNKKSADIYAKHRNENKTEIEMITGDFYVTRYLVLSDFSGSTTTGGNK